MTEQERLELYTSVVPNNRQLAIQDMKFYSFIHYTINTFTGREWGNGKENPKIFNPKQQNTDQWCEVVKSGGMKGLILTCKHHDGFCLWPTKTTKHNISQSPYKNGQGDIVREVAESCKKYGLKFGVYLSPWDRNSEFYGTEKYNDFYIAQLTELLTQYGDIFCLWMDGACASHKDGKPKQIYDFNRIWATALELQPNIILDDIGPDVRWVGNESGVCRASEWNVVPYFDIINQNLASDMQQTADFKKFQKKCVDIMEKDLGSREKLAKHNKFMWYPAEVDLSIRLGWFHHGALDFTTKSLKKLMRIYYDSVGSNGLFLLNIPPNKQGLISKRDANRIKEMGDWLAKESSLKLDCIHISPPQETARGYEIDIAFDTCNIDRMRFEEDTTKSQRVESFDIYTIKNGQEQHLYSGTIMGFGKIAIFKAITTDNIKVVITKCRLEPYIKVCEIYKTGGYII